jgi:hypothetical protein
MTAPTKPRTAETRFAGVARDPEALDEVVGVTPVRGWLALAVVIVVVLVALVWSVTAHLPQQFTVGGVVEMDPGPTAIIAGSTGSVEKLYLVPGQLIAPGDKIASIRALGGGLQPVTARTAGVVREVLVEPGQGVNALDTVATTASATLPNDTARVVTFVSALRAGPYFFVGGAVRVSVADITDGVQQTLSGRITAVAGVPTSTAGVTAEVGRPLLAQQLIQQTDGSPYRVEVTLDRRSTGARHEDLSSGQIASITVQYGNPHPISLLFGSRN